MPRYDADDTARIEARFTNDAGAPANPDSVTFTVERPDNTEQTFSGSDVLNPTTGYFYAEFVPADVLTFDTSEGVWRWRVASTGEGQGGEPGQFFVRPKYYDHWRPWVADCAARLRARTMTKGGGEVGAFTDDTRPTAEQVESLIDQASSEVLRALKIRNVPAELYEDIRTLVTVRACMHIELSYFTNEIRSDVSPYRELKELYKEGLAELQAAIEDSLDGGIDDAGGEVFLPTHSFPPAADVAAYKE